MPFLMPFLNTWTKNCPRTPSAVAAALPYIITCLHNCITKEIAKLSTILARKGIGDGCNLLFYRTRWETHLLTLGISLAHSLTH